MSPQSLPSWSIYIQIANFILTWGLAFYMYWSRRRDAGSKRLTGIEARLQKLEVSVKNPPPGVCSNHGRMEKNDVKLFERLDTLHGDMKEMSGGVKGLSATLDLINQHLINGGK